MSEASDDRAFRKHMGEVECPNCKALLYDESDYSVYEEYDEKIVICRSCGKEVY